MPFNVKEWVKGDYRTNLYYSYERLAQEVEKICRDALKKENIPHVISCRVKDPESLRAKLEKPQDFEWSPDKIAKDVFDIAGVRISLYRPEQEQQVKDIIEKNCAFVIKEIDTNVYPPPLEGRKDRTSTYELTRPRYKATHWIVRLNPAVHGSFIERPVEIQVMSLLHSAWAQIQHDYTYKPLNGDLSPAEVSTLEALGRTVELGESFLYQLSSIREERRQEEKQPFANIYELGSYLAKWFIKAYPDAQLNDLGSLTALLEVVDRIGLNSQEQLGKFLETLRPSSSRSMALAKQHFGELRLRPAVFVMHHLVNKHRDGLFRPGPEWWDGYREERRYKSRLKIIMSTMLWFFDFFPATDWEIPFSPRGQPNDGEQVKRLYWLGSWEPNELIASHNRPFSNDDQENIDALWVWFEKNDSPALCLAFMISRAEILRDVEDRVEHCLFNRLFSTLGQALENELRDFTQREAA
ncbi:uncharacterized protein DSM5745_04860 [Aspergillus mulundensis]|uniref:RelA/SpoT domain-containing protein n=1 Tax=Aspergillus mulundensis TaxID=1810919 RepID=A0A3D8S4S7_9EURO|nr:hypothetical protein DSM5745_04860 [Aspergillus mulundensis]RDW81303.1 hypothetical protein DSM5745_04860 [Aspergillus mulundensis]